jgi:fibronectin type 3 domain-containing protein
MRSITGCEYPIIRPTEVTGENWMVFATLLAKACRPAHPGILERALGRDQMSMRLLSTVRCLLILALSGLNLGRSQGPPAPVPPVFQDLYTTLNTDLNAFNASLPSPLPPYTGYSALNLTYANANSGPQLGASSLGGIQLQLQELQAMGAKAIMIQVGFPMLYEPFLTSQGLSYDQFVSFYQQVAALVRGAGLKLIIENDTLLSGGVDAGWDVASFYATLDWTQYQQARAQTAATVAQTLRPDYLVVAEEPDTESENTGQTEVDTPTGQAAMVALILPSVVAAGVPNMKVGAGVGSWQPEFQTFIQDLVPLPLDFIDFHVYPINDAFLPNALQIASIAAAAGKPVAMTECWLNKVRDDELNVLTPDQIQARDPFSFWAPLDAYFLQTIQALASDTQMLFMAPMGSQYWAAYLPYDPATEVMDPGTILASESAQASVNMNAAVYTSTATSYYSLLVTPPDTTPPSVPTGLSGSSANPTTAYLSWNASTDNVGVAGYNVYRDGALVATSANNYYQDSGLTEATPYTYAVQAFDLGQNKSAMSPSINVTTDNVTPPTAPGNVTATANSCEKVTVTWTASTGLVSIRDYLVFTGPAPNALSQTGETQSTVLQYISYPLTQGTTYYYGVEAVDIDGNTSAMSQVVSITTPLPPSAPKDLTATPISASKVSLSWQPSISGGLPIHVYQIFRGSSGSGLVQVGNASGTTYTDYSLNPSTTYYYAVQAIDTGNDTSPMSKVVDTTTLALPAAPTGLTATPDSTTRVTLSWSETVTGLPIQYYQVLRGSSPDKLSAIGNTGSTTYTDKSVSASATYYYAVQAVDTGNDISPMSEVVSITTPADPAAPTGLVATPVSPSKIGLTWNAVAGGGLPVQSYQVFRGNSSTSLSQIAKVANPSYTDTSLSPSTTYYYAITAVDSGGDVSPMSAVVPATTLALPSAPTNVAATAVSKTEVKLTWTAASSGLPLKSYSIYRGPSATNLTPLTTVGPASTSYNDQTVIAGATYYYGIEATDQQGNVSPMSTVVSVTTP